MNREGSKFASNMFIWVHILSSIILFLLTIPVIGLRLLYITIPMAVFIGAVFTFFYPMMATPLLSDEEISEIFTKIVGGKL